ncbi:MAG: YkgJ family cysteine cluster protein [Dehalococcoidales bacterium]|nr:YkgJ family cysteine cluster protein [Dehalococcoidales bacterium]
MIEAFNTLRLIHRVFDEAEKVLQDDIGKPLCVSNCGICCQHNHPRWTTIEAIHAVSVLTGTGRLDQVTKVAEGWLLEHSNEAKLYEGMPFGWASPQLRQEYNALAISQCPFLSTDMRCMIYDIRPLACRAYGVTRDNADVCPRPPGKGETQTQRRYIAAPALRAQVDNWKERCRQKNKSWIISGFVTTVFFRAAREERFRQLVKDNQIASAKIVGSDIDTTLMWQPQVNAIRSGVDPELALTTN